MLDLLAGLSARTLLFTRVNKICQVKQDLCHYM